MTAIGQTISVLSLIAVLAVATLWALGKLSLRAAWLAAIGTNIVGLIGSRLAGSTAGMTLHLIAIACFIGALAAHRMRTS
ncbi:hypothetical protein GCM10023084_03630 [Streptomyces lacrimifluminis]|uniref:hypothetical protein n=1 Tax=Streptomyces lacrimifluminis TaxID=1500077 RepID=UPI0031EAEF4B